MTASRLFSGINKLSVDDIESFLIWEDDRLHAISNGAVRKWKLNFGADDWLVIDPIIQD